MLLTLWGYPGAKPVGNACFGFEEKRMGAVQLTQGGRQCSDRRALCWWTPNKRSALAAGLLAGGIEPGNANGLAPKTQVIHRDEGLHALLLLYLFSISFTKYILGEMGKVRKSLVIQPVSLLISRG